ncbi:MAG: substrate-binding domain-containing protein, partial [Acidimicrobiia bacterium]
VLRGAYVAGVHVPADLSVVGFDDIPWAATAVPALTTVRMPTAEMAAAAIKVAIRLAGQPIRERPQASIVRVFRPELVVRESTAPPRRAAVDGT